MKRSLALACVALVAALLGIFPTSAHAQVWPYPGQSAGTPALPDAPLLPTTQPQFIASLPIPADYTPDKTLFAPFDYYEIKAAPVTAVGPWVPPGVNAATIPAGTQWLGLCKPGTFIATTGTCGTPLYTPVWGYGQVNSGGGPLGALAGKIVATYPSMNIRATKGTPVKVRWINELPAQHLFCAQPTNSNWPCAIDRTLMGTKATLPGTPALGILPNGLLNGVTDLGGPQQPDNAMVVHLHGGDIPPEADGFAEFWTGSAATAAAYSPGAIPQAIDPPMSVFNAGGAPTPLVFFRPVGDSAIYNYPMNQDAMMIWFHDHALGKTRINVVAGPAGFFQINDPGVEPPGCSKVTAPTPCLPDGKYEINVALQDRAFNAPQPGSNLATINFPNALNWAQVAPVPGQTRFSPGGNPTIHPQWVPEYFGDVPVVNGMAWPFLNVEPRMYRLHLLAGSNARCWRITRTDNADIIVIGTEQGYLNAPVPVKRLTMCPGERYDTIWDFTGNMKKKTPIVTVTNDAPAPFPKGISPKASDVGQVMQFRVNQPLVATIPNGPLPLTLVPAAVNAPLLPAGTVPCAFDPAVGGQGLHAKLPAGATACVPMRQKVLNEQLDAVTLYPLRVQIDGSPFESAITETPKVGAVEVWRIVNTTGDAHPIHTHLVRHQIVSRQKLDANAFTKATNFAVPIPLPGTVGSDASVCPIGTPARTPGCLNLGVDVAPFSGKPNPPAAYEAGWKDVSISYPGEVLTLVAKWDGHWNTATPDPGQPTGLDPITGLPTFAPAFLPVTSGPYVWHCHIVDHEDNEMMRPVLLQP
jgi:spore coat protein A, manganese oxidase